MSPILPGPIKQIGYVVTDLDAAIADWLALGVGPWFVMRGLQQTVRYRSEPCSVTLSLAWANSGDMQLELIHQTDDTPSVFTEFLAEYGPGFNQLCWWTDDFDATMAEVRAAGWPVVWEGGEGESVRFAYAEPPVGAPIAEITARTDATVGLAELVRSAAADWDGSDPIRVLMG
ncbi:VOC family protein [Mycolicibacterium arenosum]|uniref:VOC family protein n=1 Tax=Mycolicibacterium arenosum TaxID=2952157 RepID=A0ABT1M4I2_9MYCO|nr:VOC family protein [Mycolicibacterium sp. CAU 1645]MCP9273347.1 VOC family protein [Mycolicibacterium sp. CAU 1645]